MESGAALDACQILNLVEKNFLASGKDRLVDIVAALSVMSKK